MKLLFVFSILFTASLGFSVTVKTCINEAFESASKENEKHFIPSDDNDDPRFAPGPYSMLLESKLQDWSQDERLNPARVYVLKIRTSGCCGAKTVLNSYKVAVKRSLTCEIDEVKKI